MICGLLLTIYMNCDLKAALIAAFFYQHYSSLESPASLGMMKLLLFSPRNKGLCEPEGKEWSLSTE